MNSELTGGAASKETQVDPLHSAKLEQSTHLETSLIPAHPSLNRPEASLRLIDNAFSDAVSRKVGFRKQSTGVELIERRLQYAAVDSTTFTRVEEKLDKFLRVHPTKALKSRRKNRPFYLLNQNKWKPPDIEVMGLEMSHSGASRKSRIDGPSKKPTLESEVRNESVDELPLPKPLGHQRKTHSLSSDMPPNLTLRIPMPKDTENSTFIPTDRSPSSQSPQVRLRPVARVQRHMKKLASQLSLYKVAPSADKSKFSSMKSSSESSKDRNAPHGLLDLDKIHAGSNQLTRRDRLSDHHAAEDPASPQP